MIKDRLKNRTIEVFGEEHLNAMDFIMDNESGYNPLAQNKTSTAFGMFQFLDSTWASYGCKKTKNAYEQIECGIKYLKIRYGNPSLAMVFWEKHHWY